MAKWEPFTVIRPREKESVLKALRKNKPQYLWRTKKASMGRGWDFAAFLRVEKRRKK